MAISSTIASNGPYVGTGVSTAYPFTFQTESASEVQVVVDGAILTTGYTVQRNQDGTGSVTGAFLGKVELFLNPSFKQEANFERFGPFSPDQINPQLDRAARRDLWLRNTILNLAKRVEQIIGSGGVGGSATVDIEVIRDAMADFLSGIDGITVQHSDEENRFRIGMTPLFVEGLQGITVAHDATTNKLTFTADPEFIRDTIAAALTQGTGIKLTNDDITDRILIELMNANAAAGAVRSPVSIDAFTNLINITVLDTTTRIQTSSYDGTDSLGNASYVYVPAINATNLASYGRGAGISANGRGFLIDEPVLEPEMFGAKGTGSFDDQPAFDALKTEVQRVSGSNRAVKIRLRPVGYLGGGQIRGGGGLYAQSKNILDIRSVFSLEVEMNSAELRHKPGQKFGRWHSTANTPLTTGAQQPSERADIGYGLYFEDITNLRLRGKIYLDGQIHTAQIGGPFGDEGHQCEHDGFFFKNCFDVIVESIVAYRFGRDGGQIAQYGINTNTARRPHIMQKIVTYDCGRNGISQIGGNHVVIMDSDLKAGQAPNTAFGPISSSPRSALDVEAEGSVNRGTYVLRSKLRCAIPTVGSSFVTDLHGNNSDILLEDCDLEGTVYVKRPRVRFLRCKINGVLTTLGGQANPEDNTQFDTCFILDTFRNVTENVIDTDNAAGTCFRNCTFDLTRGIAMLRKARFAGRNRMIARHNTDVAANGDVLAYLEFATFDEGASFEIVDTIEPTKRPANAYRILAYENGEAGAPRGNARITSPAKKILWHATLEENTGHTGRLYSGQAAYAGGTLAPGAAASIFVPCPRAHYLDDVAYGFSGSMAGLKHSAQGQPDGGGRVVISISNPNAGSITYAGGEVWVQNTKSPQ